MPTPTEAEALLAAYKVTDGFLYEILAKPGLIVLRCLFQTFENEQWTSKHVEIGLEHPRSTVLDYRLPHAFGDVDGGEMGDFHLIEATGSINDATFHLATTFGNITAHGANLRIDPWECSELLK